MEIVLGAGVGPLRLGMTVAEVLSKMTEDRQYEEWMGGNLNDSLCYPGILVRFDRTGRSEPPPSARLDGIQIRKRAELSLLGRPFANWRALELTRALTGSGIDWKFEDAGAAVGIPALRTTFYFEPDGSLREIRIGDY